MTKKAHKTALLTPMQVREAVIEWAHTNGMFPPSWDLERAWTCAVVLDETGGAHIRIDTATEVKR